MTSETSTVPMPYARSGYVGAAASDQLTEMTRETPVKEGRPDISELAALSGEALRTALVARANALLPLLTQNAAKTEEIRRLPEENIAAIRAAGLDKIMVPRRFGGLETSLRTSLDVSRELGKACGSTAWVVTLLNVCAWFTGLGSEQLQQDVWGQNPDANIAGVFAPLATSRRVEGGFMVSGKWPWASGSLHAQWGFLGIPLVNETGETIGQGFCVIPGADLTIEETWFVAGMRGTGSNTFIAKDVFVPDHRIMPVADLLQGDYLTPYEDEILYRSAFVPVAALVLAGPQLGLATQALDFVIEKAPKRAISYTFYEKQTIAPTFQLAIAKAATLVDTAHLHAYRAAEDVDRAAREGRKLTYKERARVRMDTGHVVESAREAIRILCTAHGAGSFAEASPMQRIWRDSEVASRHAVISPDISAEVYGRALLGFTEGVTALV